jgi:2-polyprenyl-6-methoxyphenol hydroxylase-like FAD-dependent oxidoreductase
MKTHETQILVAGAGPVGLATALAFVRKGFSVEIIDPRRRGSTKDYACILHKPTIDRLAAMGLTNITLDGIPLQKATVRSDGAQSILEFGDRPPAVYGQMQLEAALEAELRSAGVTVRRGWRLASFEPSANGVACEVDELDSCQVGYAVARTETLVRRKHRFNARILIGADGRESLVRNQASIAFEDYAPAVVYRMAELTVRNPLAAQIHVSRQGQANHAVFPLAGKRIRVCLDLEGETDVNYPKEKPESWVDLTPCKCVLEQFAYWLSSKFPWLECQCETLEWCRMIRFDHRIAARFSADRVILLGDAAYIDSPIGAPGLNSGIQIACDLADLITPYTGTGDIDSILAGYHSKLLHHAHVAAQLRVTPMPTPRQLIDCFSLLTHQIH